MTNSLRVVEGNKDEMDKTKALEAALGQKRSIILIHGARYKDELLYVNQFKKMPRAKSFNYIPTLTKGRGYNNGRVTDHLKKMNVDPNTEVYICGIPTLVKDCKTILENMGVENVFSEAF